MVTVTYNLAAIAEQKELSLSEAHNRTHPTLYMLAQMAEELGVPLETLYTVNVL